MAGPDSEPLDRGALGRGRNSVSANRPSTCTPLARLPAAPCEAGTAGPAPHRVVPGSQPTQCNTLGLARGSGPFEPPTGGSAPHVPPITPAAPFSLSHDRGLDGARSDSDGGDGPFGEAFDHNGEGLRPLREKRWGGGSHAPPLCATGAFWVARWSDSTALTPGGGNRRSFLGRSRPGFPAPIGRSSP